MWQKDILLACLSAFLALTSVTAQRSTPQFSFQQASPQGNQFGSDIFSPNGQLNFPSMSNSAGAQSSFMQVNTGSQQGPASLLDPSFPSSNQLLSQSMPSQISFLQPDEPKSQSQQPRLEQPRLEQPRLEQPRFEQPRLEQPSIQPVRPSLSLTAIPQQSQQSQSSLRQTLSQQLGLQAPQSATLPTPIEVSTRQPARRQQQSAPASSSVSTSTSSSVSTSSSSSATGLRSASAPVSSSAAVESATNQRGQQQNNQQLNSNQNSHVRSMESARRAEATSASAAAHSGQSFNCPDSFGFFRHHKSCDKYWACVNGTATLKICGNGLNFDDSDPKRENCAYPFSVDCGSDRTDFEPPISTPNCPRLYGLFSDTSNCRVFYSCWNGEASKYECPPGLAYDSEQRVCVWADLVDRCDQSEVSDGFVCPDATEIDQPGHYTRHAHPTDCRKFYVCIDGTARPYGCSFGTVFNVDSLQCDEPESVSGCEKYYGDLDPKLAKKLARESQSGNVGSTETSARGNSRSAN